MNSQIKSLKNKNRIKLLILWLIPFGLMLIASLVYWLVQNNHLTLSSKNEGELLIPPINIHELALTTNKNNSDAWKNKWTMVIRGSDQCSGICEEALHLTRQIHIRLNEKADRVRRIYLSDMSDLSPDLSKNLEANHKFVSVVTPPDDFISIFDDRLNQISIKIGSPISFALVDPDGWLMMAYSPNHDGSQVLKDLKFLLKYSVER
jgi:cytochrome oxidase Cu insertion factor (SCO1/SenC/PrrC family)